jgi:small-conductance mechanosensitive channel
VFDLHSLSLTQEVYGNALWRWLAAVAGTLVFWLVAVAILRFAKAGVRRWTRARSDAATQLLSDLLAHTHKWFLFGLALAIAFRIPELPGRGEGIVRGVFVVALWLQVALWLKRLLSWVVKEVVVGDHKDDPARLTNMVALNFLGQLVIWSLVLLAALDNLGVNVTALVAGFGVGGIAVALAAQRVLGDLFASLSIVLDRPFEVGDFIIVGDYLGTVQRIGLKTTRVRSLSGEQLVFGNNDLLESRIRNYKRMQERRVVFGVGVTYQTPHQKLQKIPAMLREAVEAQQNVRFDRAHFKAFEDSSLSFEIVYYVLTPDYNVYMDIQQAINLAIFQRFENEEIDFAYPTRTLHVSPLGAEPSVAFGDESSRDEDTREESVKNGRGRDDRVSPRATSPSARD